MMSMALAVTDPKMICQKKYKITHKPAGRFRSALFTVGSVVGIPILILAAVFVSVFSVTLPFAWAFGWL